jgi:putative redox protein
MSRVSRVDRNEAVWTNLAAPKPQCSLILHPCNMIRIMVRIQTEYQGDLHCTSVHTPSKTELATDAPVDNQGRGESFSPTDLIATSLGTCMLTMMGIVARTLDVDLTGATATVEKEMSSAPPRRINRLTVAIRVPRTTSPENQQRLENAAHTCPVKKSIHPDIETPIKFVWG